MDYKKITTKEQHQEYLKRMKALIRLDPDEGSLEGNEFYLLSLIINDYEKNIYEIEKSKPLDYIKIRIEEMGLKQKDLISIFGSQSQASQVLAGKRQLTKQMMKNLHDSLKIPYEFLFETEPKQTEEIIISFANRSIAPNVIAKCYGRIKHKDSILKDGLRLNSIINDRISKVKRNENRNLSGVTNLKAKETVNSRQRIKK